MRWIAETLRQVAANILARKRRPGHYAVIWRDGRPMMIGVIIGEADPADDNQDRQF